MDKKELDKLYYLKNKEKIKEQRKKRYQENKEKELEQNKRYHNEHKEEISLYQKQYIIDNNDKLKAYKKEYYSKMHGRSLRLVNHYKREDKKHQRGECTLTAEWIIDNIFSKPCIYCGKTNWIEIGCDRIDNTKPHTENNVVPCCFDCNRKKGTMNYDDYMQKMLGNKS